MTKVEVMNKKSNIIEGYDNFTHEFEMNFFRLISSLENDKMPNVVKCEKTKTGVPFCIKLEFSNNGEVFNVKLMDNGEVDVEISKYKKQFCDEEMEKNLIRTCNVINNLI